MIRYFLISMDIWAAIFCLVAAVVIFPARSFDRGSSYSCIALLLTDCLLNIAEVVGWVCDKSDGPLARIMVRQAYLTVYICAFLLVICMIWHISMVIKTRRGRVNRNMVKMTLIMSAAGIVTVIVSAFTGLIYTINEQNRFVRGDGYWIAIAIGGVAMIPILIQVIENRYALRKREFIVFICMVIFAEIGGIIQIMTRDLSAINVANSVSLILLILVHQFEYSSDMIERERMRAIEQIKLYTKQIRPHFIYNSLSAIRAYVPEDSKAWESLNHFAGFLRGSIDLLSAEGCIPVEREFEAVRDYLYMEKERFGEDLEVEMDIRDAGFLIPPFTIQTLVENAVHHGIREKTDGRGTLVLKSYESKEAHIIEVIDDGVGFDINEKEAGHSDDERAHIGLENIKKRLKLMCKGTLKLESEPKKGCRALVTIPKK